MFDYIILVIGIILGILGFIVYCIFLFIAYKCLSNSLEEIEKNKIRKIE